MPTARLDRYGGVAELAEVVGRGLHVEHPDLAREVEGVADQLARNQRRQLERPLVDVHAGVQAARLLHRHLALPSGAQRVPGRRRVGEEPVGVEVRAADAVPLHHGVGAGAAQPQGPTGVPYVIGGDAVHHRPLVQPEAPQLRRPGEGGGQQSSHEGHGRAASGQEPRDVDLDAVADHAVVRPRGTGKVRGILQQDTRAGVPPPQARR